MRVNGETFPDPGGVTLETWLRANGYDPTKVAVAIDGDVVPKAESGSRRLADGDDLEIVGFVGGGRTISYEERTARTDPGAREALRGATIGIAGLGGLGSNVAVMLVRSGAMHIVGSDFDTVEASNLNRQMYFARDVGRPKAEALTDILRSIDPEVDSDLRVERLDPDNIPERFGGCDIIVEAFDSASDKKMIIETVCTRMPGIPLVCGNGMAGCGPANDIMTRSVFGDVTMCGDGVSDGPSEGLMAPRMNVCAGHMANAVVRILMGSKP